MGLTIIYSKCDAQEVSTVPKPASIALFGLASLGMGMIARRRKKQISELMA
jgi:hypothetical protein